MFIHKDNYEIVSDIKQMARYDQYRVRCKMCGKEFSLSSWIDNLKHWFYCRDIRKERNKLGSYGKNLIL